MTMDHDTTNPPGAPPEYAARRVYFETLTGLLLAQGLDGSRVGELVAELDSDLEMSGADPVEEFGPAGEFATALIRSGGSARPARYLAAQLAFALSLGTAGAALLSIGNHTAPGVVTLHVSMIFTVAAIAIGVWALKAFGSSRSVGRSSLPLPSLGWFALYITFVVGVSLLTANLDVDMSPWVAWLVLGVSGLASIVTLTVATRMQRVSVPGNARHLRNLGWGWMGR